MKLLAEIQPKLRTFIFSLLVFLMRNKNRYLKREDFISKEFFSPHQSPALTLLARDLWNAWPPWKKMLALLKVTNCHPASSFYIRKLMGTMYSQGTWTQSKLQAPTEKVKLPGLLKSFPANGENCWQSKRAKFLWNWLSPGQTVVFESCL